MDLQLKGKIALISGSTAGIGNAIAASLAREGARAILNGRTQAAVDVAVAAMKGATGGDVVHAAATVVASLLLAGAMVTVALTTDLPVADRRLAAVAASLIVPLGGALGLIMLLVSFAILLLLNLLQRRMGVRP